MIFYNLRLRIFASKNINIVASVAVVVPKIAIETIKAVSVFSNTTKTSIFLLTF